MLAHLGAFAHWWGGGWGDLAPMMSQPLGSLGLWTVNDPRDGPSAPS